MTAAQPARSAIAPAPILVLLALASGLCGGCDLLLFGQPSEDEDRFQLTAPEVWPMKDLYDGESDVPTDHVIGLRAVHWHAIRERGRDVLDGRTHEALPWLILVRGSDYTLHPFRTDTRSVESGSIDLTPVGGLDADEDYFLVFPTCSFQPHALCPPPQRFSTRSAPQVVGLYRAGDTLLVIFSEPMDPDSLFLGYESVNMLFEEDGQSRSVVKDLNVGDFAWDTEGVMFQVTPISEIPFDLVLGPAVRAMSGEPLDSDGDGLSDPETNFVHHVYPTNLPICHTRPDYADPCITEQQAETRWVDYDAPFIVELDVPGQTGQVFVNQEM